MKTTIYDVAKAAGVSIATVSKVINGKGRISEQTRKKVLQVIERLNYQPNVIASALTGKSTYTIGLLIPDLANPFFSELARNIEDRGHELGYNLFICSTDYDPQKERNYVELMKRKNVDGIILASGFEQENNLKALLEEQFPVSVVARDFPGLPVNTVCIDDFHGGYEAASHLIGLGHKKIAIIARNVRSNRERMRGYAQAMKDHRIHYDYPFEYVKESNVASGKYVADKYLRSSDPPTAIFACNDLLAIGAIQAAKEHGLKVPEDLSIVGFDDTVFASITEPPLTTVAQPIKKMGQEAMNVMINEIQGKATDKLKIVLIPRLVVRNSTAERK